MKYITTIGEREYIVEVLDDGHVTVDGIPYGVDFNSVGEQPVYSLLVDGRSFEAYVFPGEEDWQVILHGRLFPVLVEDEREKRIRQSSGSRAAEHQDFHLKSPMPGLVVSVPVGEGQEVQKGDVLVVLESMKMQNELKSPRAGVVMRLKVRPGDNVEQRQTLLSVV